VFNFISLLVVYHVRAELSRGYFEIFQRVSRRLTECDIETLSARRGLVCCSQNFAENLEKTLLTNALLCGIIRVQGKKKEPALPAIAKEVNNGI
jgi:hypothetical protein